MMTPAYQEFKASNKKISIARLCYFGCIFHLFAFSHVLGHLVSLVLHFLDVTNHVESHLW